MSTVKSGWLSRRDGVVFKNWTKKHCVLYTDGEFSVYSKASDATAETRINVTTQCSKIEVGFDVGSINLPKDVSDVESAFAVVMKTGKRHIFCAFTDAECRSWVGVLENARTMPPLSKKVPDAPHEVIPPPAYAPPMYSQPVQGGPPQQQMQPRPPAGYYNPQPGYAPPPGYAPQPMYGPPRPMYGQQPAYGQPMYGQPVYVSQVPQQQPQQQQRSNNNTRNMMLAGGGGLLGGYLLGNAMSEMSHHHYGYGGGGGYDGGGGGFDGGGGGFDSGGFDGGGGGFDSGGFDF